MIDKKIIEENIIVQHKISSLDSVLHLGVGYKNGIVLDSFCEYWDITDSELDTFTGVDVDNFKINELSNKFTSSDFWNKSMQEFLDNLPTQETSYDWCILTGVFNEYLYGVMQHDFMLYTINRCLEISKNGVIFTFKENLTDEFKYNPIFIFSSLITTYSKVFVQKIEDDNNYIFSILK